MRCAWEQADQEHFSLIYAERGRRGMTFHELLENVEHKNSSTRRR